jgi:hypothetical protein
MRGSHFRINEVDRSNLRFVIPFGSCQEGQQIEKFGKHIKNQVEGDLSPGL